MPELPEVETIRQGIAPLVTGQPIESVTVRCAKLRWPLPEQALSRALPGQHVASVERRGKYLLLSIGEGTLIVHLGMSGVLRFLPMDLPYGKHDHFNIGFHQGGQLRLTDPRRFGSVLWTTDDPNSHRLIQPLGPEPLADSFIADSLLKSCRGRRVAIKNRIMNAHVVVGVGNIYAAESLFLAGIHPETPAGHVDGAGCERLVAAIKQVLTAAIQQGGTTLRDFRRGDGQPGYFQQSLQIYGREGQPCLRCGSLVEQVRQGGRASAFCPHCQPLI
ncbi:MAG: bifunctional DNA-formamidopyrimidine glycosylase/DNA-(apurinic or apyrimidinic site) lyase [Magnetococcales bacterium]|nr:bifunctional DNA-formamidopyrimidine glycosylase/DNA-(apurinic or apyrimidinic site) lyase [Magnetococcales bacterium]